ncbi:MAG: type II secretion system protein GspG [Planctomycetes bacterium]|nr:type II secretion system protein GspG [Planctomycetota bacterium]
MEPESAPYSYDGGEGIPPSRMGLVIVIVGAIVVALAAAAVVSALRSGFSGSKDAARVSYTRSIVQDLSVALKAYETDFGTYPPSGNAELVRVLQAPGPKNTSYFWFRSADVNAQGEWLDYWGHPYHYERIPGGTFLFYSRGLNGEDEHGSGDDIVFRK